LFSTAAAGVSAVFTGEKVFRRMTGAGSAEKSISRLESRLGGRLGVAALDTSTGRRVEHRALERFPMCSTFKLLLAAAILVRIDAGKERLDRPVPYGKDDLLGYAPVTGPHVQQGHMTVSALCAAAIEYSDNTAANLLLKVLGGPPQVTRYARSLGDSVTRLDRNEPSLNTAIPGDDRDTTSPSAMLHDMQKLLLEQKALSPNSRKQLEEWLIADVTGAMKLRAGLPSAWRIGDKTGSGRNGANNDIAVCWRPNRKPILIAVYSVGSHMSDADRDGALAEVGRIVAAEFS
jgi:beta-lactamase class A